MQRRVTTTAVNVMTTANNPPTTVGRIAHAVIPLAIDDPVPAVAAVAYMSSPAPRQEFANTNPPSRKIR